MVVSPARPAQTSASAAWPAPAPAMESTSCPWSSLKALSALLEAAILQRQDGLKHDLEVALRKHKPQFIALLKNPIRSPGDADLVRKAQSDGIRLPSSNTVQKLPPAIVEETLILSDMLNLNEISALQLLLKGEEQLSQHPGLTRGLVAVLIYYDGRKTLVQCLRTLMQGREGMTWTLELNEEITELVTAFTDQLVEEGLVEKTLNLLAELDWEKEVVTLQRNMALGDNKHRHQVQVLFSDVRQCLADCVFSFAAQSGLQRNDTIKLLDFLSKTKPGEAGTNGAINSTTLTLLMSLLYAFDVSSILKREDGEAVVQRLPILEDPQFLSVLHRELGPQSPRHWENPALQAVAQFGWAMCISALRSLPQSNAAQNVAEDDEAVMDLALDNKVFHYFPDFVLANESVFTEEFYLNRLHQLVTDFIVLMPLKVKELRNRADDAARNSLMYEQEGIQYTSPLSGQHFEHFLTTIAKLYECDPLDLGLVNAFWCPTFAGAHQGVLSLATDATATSMLERVPQRQISLYKFVRLAGDLLMPSLYTPYVSMLVSLSSHAQAALHCFNLLKLNGTGNSGSSNTISWDHFFASMQQYHNNLRQEQQQQQQILQTTAFDTVYRLARPLTRGISPGEARGLMSVLRLIANVCWHCDAARVAMAEHASWKPILVMTGLLGCAVPVPLKAELLRALSAMARTPDIALLVWESMESAQLLATAHFSEAVKVSSLMQQQLQKNGLGSELENVESKNEEYPMTRAFLGLLDTLLDCNVPLSLGTGTRNHGFEPYLVFVRDSVFLRFNTRAYRFHNEKWKVAEGCLRLFLKLLSSYVPQTSDFALTSSAEVQARHPGFSLMSQLLQTSEVLRMLLFIVDEGCQLLDAYVDFPGKKDLESCCLLALRILSKAADLESAFVDCARAANTPILLTPFIQLLMGINPRSGRPDHMLNVCKYVTYSWWLPHHTYTAIRLLSFVAEPASAHPPLLAVINSNDHIGKIIIKGFTDVLESVEDEKEDPDGLGETLDSTNWQKGPGIREARLAAVNLLLSGLDKPAPSLSHFLLGFDLSRGVSRSALQAPGVLGAVRTPLHALIAVLRPSAPRHPSLAFLRTPQLCEAAYRLLYHLAAHPTTSEPTLRYLRSNEDFLCTQLTLLPLDENIIEPSLAIVKGISWLLKTVAIELKTVCSSRLRSQAANLISLLLQGGVSSLSMHPTDEAAGGTYLSVAESSSLAQLSRSLATASRAEGSEVSAPSAAKQNYRLLQLLDAIDFRKMSLAEPSYEIFDGAQLAHVFKTCEVVGVGGERMISIQALHQVLNKELVNLPGATAMSHRQAFQQEVKSILLHAVSWNSLREHEQTKRGLLDGWRQVTEVLLCCIPHDVVSTSAKQQLLLDLLQMLIAKVLDDHTMPELSNQVSGVVLLLLVALRHTYNPVAGEAAAQAEARGGAAHTFLAAAESEAGQRRESMSRQNMQQKNYSTSLHVILRGLISWIISTSSSSQQVRSNLYSAFLYYLRIGKTDQSSSEMSELAKFRKTNLDVISGFGEPFLEVVCRDIVSGHDIRRMLALSLLDELVLLDGRGRWTQYVSAQGYLRHIIESLASENHLLLKLLSPSEDFGSSRNLRALYVYESKMATLARMATSVNGAATLMQAGLLLRLAEMSVFSARPDRLPVSDDNGHDVLSRYRQILFPALRVCQALLASLGRDNRSATAQVLHFIVAHDDHMLDILKSARASSETWTLAQLQELALLTGVLALSVEIAEESASDCADLHLVASVSRIRKHLIALAPLFDASEELTRRLQQRMPDDNSKTNAARFLQEISFSVSRYTLK